MIVFDEDDKIIDPPNDDSGYIDQVEVPVRHIYIIDQVALTREVVVKEYPETGGKDVETVTIIPEEGHFETYDLDGNRIYNFDGDIPEGFPDGEPIEDVWVKNVWRNYSEEQLAEIAKAKEEQAEYDRKYQEQQEFLENAPALLEVTSMALADLAINGTMSNDTAVPLIGELVRTQKIGLDQVPQKLSGSAKAYVIARDEGLIDDRKTYIPTITR